MREKEGELCAQEQDNIPSPVYHAEDMYTCIEVDTSSCDVLTHHGDEVGSRSSQMTAELIQDTFMEL